MFKGRYTNSPVDFNALQVNLFTPSIYNPTIYSKMGCGVTALSLLTGDHPSNVRKANKERESYPDRFMVNYLKDREFIVVPITKRNITSCDASIYPLSSTNVILISQMMCKKEASWFVFYKNFFYHNFKLSKVDHLDFINKPIMTAYCLWHEKWDTYNSLKKWII